ncbi:Aryl hydrocarbon receptor [Dirofilaria immitis]|nr:Aryl hydrocarbon receptor [Dirofilaria immitis]
MNDCQTSIDVLDNLWYHPFLVTMATPDKTQYWPLKGNCTKGVREVSKPGIATNPSKRHRERLNSELEIVAALLPYEQSVISRLDKLSVLRLAVSYLQIKTHFQACLHRYIANFPFAFAHSYPFIPTNDTTISYDGGIPTAIHRSSGQSLIDPNEYDFESMALKALGGFILILNENGDIYYVSENIEIYLGFHQSDILHQPLFEMIHSEDREDIKLQLAWNYNIPLHVSCLQDILTPGGMPYLERNFNARFRCLLDNTCGFWIDVRGKLMSLHGLPHSYVFHRAENHSSTNIVLGLVAICSPFVPPNVADQQQQQMDDPILKTKHSLDFMLISTDNRMKALLELDDKNLPYSFYSLVHVDDATCIAEAHKEVTKNSASGILIYRLISLLSQRIYWIQSSCRMFYKNGKPETIGLTHRILTEVEGTMLLEKRTSLRAKLLSFDDSLLQSPSNLQSTAALPSTSCGKHKHRWFSGRMLACHAGGPDTTSLSLYMTGSDKNRYTTTKRHDRQFSTLSSTTR